MQKWTDPTLFVDDPISDYLESIQPHGMKALYFGLSLFMNPVYGAKWVPIALFYFTIGLLFYVVKQMAGSAAGFVAVLAFMGYEGGSHIFSSGTASDFMPPIFLGIMCFVYLQKRILLSAFCILAVLFYPSTFLVSGSVVVLWNTFAPGRERTLGAMTEKVAESVLILAPAFITLIAIMAFFGGGWGEMVSRLEMDKLPQFGPGGVEPFAHLPFWPWLSGFRSGFGIDGGWIVLAALSMIAAFLPGGNKSRGKVFVGMVAACCLFWFVAAHGLAVRIGFPTNYVRFSLPICMVLWIAICVGESKFFMNASGSFLKAKFIFSLVVITAMSVPFWNKGYDDFRPVAPLYGFLSKLPKTALIVGPPILLEGAPAISGVKTFVAKQAEGGFHKKYVQLYHQRMLDFLDAYYSSDKDSFCALALKNGFDYMVVDERLFDPAQLDELPGYNSPYDQKVRELITGRTNFYLLNINPSEKVFQDGPLYVQQINCKE